MTRKNGKAKALVVIIAGLLFIFLLALLVIAIVLNAVSGEPQVESAVVLAALATALTYGILKHRAQ